MNKQTQDLLWASLSKEERKRHRDGYRAEVKVLSYNSGFNDALESIFGHHNLTSDTEPEEMLHCSRDFVIEKYKTLIENRDGQHRINSPELENWYAGRAVELKELFGDKCLPNKAKEQSNPNISATQEELNRATPNKSVDEIAEEIAEKCICPVRKQLNIEQSKPKFKPNDEVYLLGIDHKHRETILDIIGQENGEWVYHLKNSFGGYAEHNLEPYTEPETKDKSLKEQQEFQERILCNPDRPTDEEIYRDLTGEIPIETEEKEDNMEEKELDIYELLESNDDVKTIYSVIHDAEVEFKLANRYIEFMGIGYYSNGSMYDVAGRCMLYPSRALYEKYPLDPYSAWMEWKEARTPKRWRAKQYQNYWYFDRRFIPKGCTANANSDFDETNYKNGNYFRTEEKAKQAAEAVRECLEKFHKDYNEK